MIIKIYDFADKTADFTIPDDKTISEIDVTVLSGDETGRITFTDGTYINFDASNCRLHDFYDGSYTVKGDNIQKWIDFDADCCSGTISYARQDEFEDLED
jgi:hypothetical protein